MVQDESVYSIKPEKNRRASLFCYTVKLLTKLFDVATLSMIYFLIDYMYIIRIVQLQEIFNFLISGNKMNETNWAFEQLSCVSYAYHIVINSIRQGTQATTFFHSRLNDSKD
jgi:hypothetical protein